MAAQVAVNSQIPNEFSRFTIGIELPLTILIIDVRSYASGCEPGFSNGTTHRIGHQITCIRQN